VARREDAEGYFPLYRSLLERAAVPPHPTPRTVYSMLSSLPEGPYREQLRRYIEQDFICPYIVITAS